MDELLDLVNEKDEVVGEVWKSKANSNPKLIHREIGVCIFDDKNRLLMQQRSLNKSVYPGYWIETCGGHVLKGEDPETAAHRELKEEMGFDTKLTFAEKTLDHFPNETFWGYGYVGKYGGEKIEIQKEEVEQAKFFTREEFEELVKTSGLVMGLVVDWIRKVWIQQKSP